MKAVKTSAKVGEQAFNYRRDSDGFPYPLTIKDAPAQCYTWGTVSGAALMFDLFNWRKQLTDEQASENVGDFVLALIKEAAEELANPIGGVEVRDHRGVAVGFLSGIADLVAYALESEDMRKLMKANLAALAETQEKLILNELADAKATALNIRGIKPPKSGGPNV